MVMVDTDNLVTLRQAGVRLGTIPSAPVDWAGRYHDFPQPVWMNSSHFRLYDIHDIRDWLSDHPEVLSRTPAAPPTA